MFFGVIVKSNLKESKPIVLPTALKLTQAVLEPNKNGKKEPVSLLAEYEKKQFILCVLEPGSTWQCPLDLCFEGGSEVKFFVRGQGTIHLTGYEGLDDLDDMSMSMSDDEEITSESDAEGDVKISELKSSAQKKKATNGVVAKTNGTKNTPTKGIKRKKGQDEDEDDEFSDEEESDDDSECGIDALGDLDSGSDSDDDDFEHDGEDDDDDDEEEDEDDDDLDGEDFEMDDSDDDE